ncbi:MAG: septum formation protein Maf [Chloroflexi bacterium]|nr:septum formation protein Maf [Chloroflexota bacterium]
MNKQDFVLASASPRRRELLGLFGLPFTCQSADIDESILVGEDPTVYVQRLAKEKNEAVQADALVLSADTIVAYNGSVMGKPSDAREAAEMLADLRGKDHRVYTALYLRNNGQALADCCQTSVSMRLYTQAEVDAYVASGDYQDKAGGYAIQHKGFHPVEGVDGCYANVMGLPLCHLLCLVHQAGLRIDVDIPALCQQHLGIQCEVFPNILARCDADNRELV